MPYARLQRYAICVRKMSGGFMPGSGILATIGDAMLQFSRDDYVVVPQSLNTDPARVIVALVEGGGGSFSVIFLPIVHVG